MTQQQRGLFPETAAVIGASGDRDLLDYADCQLPTFFTFPLDLLDQANYLDGVFRREQVCPDDPEASFF